MIRRGEQGDLVLRGDKPSRPPGARGAGLQPYSLRELRAPAPRGYFLCKQKVTKKLPKPEVLDSS